MFFTEFDLLLCPWIHISLLRNEEVVAMHIYQFVISFIWNKLKMDMLHPPNFVSYIIE